MKIQEIAERAIQLAGSMSHGNACYAACREAGVPESEVAWTAEIVSGEVTNLEMNPREAAADEIAKKKFIAAHVPEKLAEIVIELEREAAGREPGWGKGRIGAIRAGKPRALDLSEAERRCEKDMAILSIA